jgi:peptidoglycan hydrolase CwlO-like protein
MTNTNYPSATPQNKPSKNKNSKNLVIGILAVVLLGTWGYFLYDKNKSTEKVQTFQTQSTSYMTQRDSLKLLYNDAEGRLDSITGANNNLQGTLTDRQKDINSLKTQIRGILSKKNASDAELAQAKGLIGQLNDKISGLEADVARLTGENQQLTSDNSTLKQDKSTLEENLQTTKSEKEDLEKTVDVASTFSASNIQVTPVQEKKSGKEKTTTTAKRVDKLVVSFDVENRIAKSGPADMYIMVTAPDGKVISDPSLGSGTLTTRTDGDKSFTSKVSIQYDQGTRKLIELPIRQSGFQTGDYKIEIYHNGFKIGEGTRTLKKGGLFG